ncbi:MAG: GIY-YIG nuclease family protein [Ignavibacteria bacterium]|nr:GIY-YIG nuclease family protein [Ignavibacteria bacterium]
MNTYFVYILSNINKTVLYVGFTNDIIRRIQEHKDKKYDGFTKFYNVNRLVYFENHDTVEEAMRREKQLKKWNRDWKNNLINKWNPDWKDLSENFNKKLADLEFLELLYKNLNN